MTDKIEERGLRAKIKEFLDSHFKSVTSKKVLRIIDGFPSIDAFRNAHPTEWLLKYRNARPKSSFDLGVTVRKALKDTVAFIQECQRNEELDKKARERAEKEAQEAEAKAKLEAELEEERRNPKFTLNEIKALVSIMELCDLAAIDLRAIRLFMKSVNVKIKES